MEEVLISNGGVIDYSVNEGLNQSNSSSEEERLPFEKGQFKLPTVNGIQTKAVIPNKNSNILLISSDFVASGEIAFTNEDHEMTEGEDMMMPIHL